MTDLFRKKTVHDKQHDTLKAAENGEQIRHDNGALFKLETAKDPHGAKYTELRHCSNGERPAGGNKCTLVKYEELDFFVLRRILFTHF